jgi:oxidoreductase, short chain dehydrogenase/reductase family protein
VSTFGNLTGLVTSAGYYRQELLENEKSEEIRRIFEVNVFGTVLLCRAAYGALKKQGGSIVIISSDAGLQGNTACSIYGATKGAVTAFAKSLALEGATHKIRVNALCPGDVMTPLVEKQLAEDTSLSLGDMASVYPLGRIATADEVGKVVAFLLSDDASFITGTALPVDGGLTSC